MILNPGVTRLEIHVFQIQIHDLLVQIRELRAQIHELQLSFTSYLFKSMSCELKLMS